MALAIDRHFFKRNNAIGGSGVLYGTHLFDELVDLRPSDDAHKVFVLIGTNDIDLTDAFRAEYEAQINRLKLGNPNATFYLLGVLNRFRGDMTKRDTHNPMIAQVAANTSSIYINTDGLLTEADTYDQLHPNEAGFQKIADFIAPYALY